MFFAMLDKGMLCCFRNIHPSVQKLRPEKDPGGENEASQWNEIRTRHNYLMILWFYDRKYDKYPSS